MVPAILRWGVPLYFLRTQELPQKALNQRSRFKSLVLRNHRRRHLMPSTICSSKVLQCCSNAAAPMFESKRHIHLQRWSRVSGIRALSSKF